MSGSGEPSGDLVQSGLIARAATPSHGDGTRGEAGDGPIHAAACLNCRTALIGTHCHSCGQPAHVHKTLRAFFHDLVHGVFHFEGKIWRTLPLLAWHPGKLTRQYIDGRRASYVSPIALFLFVVFLTFAIFNLAGRGVHFAGGKDWLGDAGNAAATESEAARLAKLKAQLAAATKAGQRTGAIEGEIAGAEGALAGLRAGKAAVKLPKQIAAADGPAGNAMVDTINRGWQGATENPDLALFKLQSSAYKYSWLLIPLSVPFVWLLFPFSRRFRLYDHTVFVTYSLCFMLIVLAVMTTISTWLTPNWPIAVCALYVPFHMHRQLRETYGLSRFGALWRTWLMSIFAFVVLGLFSVAVLGLAMN